MYIYWESQTYCTAAQTGGQGARKGLGPLAASEGPDSWPLLPASSPSLDPASYPMARPPFCLKRPGLLPNGPASFASQKAWPPSQWPCLLPQKAWLRWSGLLPIGPASFSMSLPPLCLLPQKAWPHWPGLLPNGPSWLFFGRILKTGGKLNSTADCISNSNGRERRLAQMWRCCKRNRELKHCVRSAGRWLMASEVWRT